MSCACFKPRGKCPPGLSVLGRPKSVESCKRTARNGRFRVTENTTSERCELVAVGLGNATITYEWNGMTATKEIRVVEDSVAIPPIPINYKHAYGMAWKDLYVDEVQILINGENGGLARFIDGNLYAPLDKMGYIKMGYILGARIVYDEGSKTYTFNGKPVNCRVVGPIVYMRLADLRTPAGARLEYIGSEKLLQISV